MGHKQNMKKGERTTKREIETERETEIESQRERERQKGLSVVSGERSCALEGIKQCVLIWYMYVYVCAYACVFMCVHVCQRWTEGMGELCRAPK